MTTDTKTIVFIIGKIATISVASVFIWLAFRSIPPSLQEQAATTTHDDFYGFNQCLVLILTLGLSLLIPRLKFSFVEFILRMLQLACFWYIQNHLNSVGLSLWEININFKQINNFYHKSSIGFALLSGLVLFEFGVRLPKCHIDKQLLFTTYLSKAAFVILGLLSYSNTEIWMCLIWCLILVVDMTAEHKIWAKLGIGRVKLPVMQFWLNALLFIFIVMPTLYNLTSPILVYGLPIIICLYGRIASKLQPHYSWMAIRIGFECFVIHYLLQTGFFIVDYLLHGALIVLLYFLYFCSYLGIGYLLLGQILLTFLPADVVTKIGQISAMARQIGFERQNTLVQRLLLQQLQPQTIQQQERLEQQQERPEQTEAQEHLSQQPQNTRNQPQNQETEEEQPQKVVKQPEKPFIQPELKEPGKEHDD